MQQAWDLWLAVWLEYCRGLQNSTEVHLWRQELQHTIIMLNTISRSRLFGISGDFQLKERNLNFLLLNLFLLMLIIIYSLYIAFYDRKYKKQKVKRNGIISIIVISSGVFLSWLTSIYYIGELEIKYLLPILIYAVVTISMIAYACLIKKIYNTKNKCR